MISAFLFVGSRISDSFGISRRATLFLLAAHHMMRLAFLFCGMIGRFLGLCHGIFLLLRLNSAMSKPSSDRGLFFAWHTFCFSDRDESNIDELTVETLPSFFLSAQRNPFFVFDSFAV